MTPGADVALVHHSDAGSQYTSMDYTQTLDDHGVLASIGTVGDAMDNALAESFVDSYKTELIADRVWRSQAQLELATVEWVAWFNHDRLHDSSATSRRSSSSSYTPRRRDRAHNGRRAFDGRRRFRGQPPDLSRERSRAPNRDPLRPRRRRSRDERPRVASPT